MQVIEYPKRLTTFTQRATFRAGWLAGAENKIQQQRDPLTYTSDNDTEPPVNVDAELWMEGWDEGWRAKAVEMGLNPSE